MMTIWKFFMRIMASQQDLVTYPEIWVCGTATASNLFCNPSLIPYASKLSKDAFLSLIHHEIMKDRKMDAGDWQVHDPTSTSDIPPPLYDIAESPPPPYAAVEMQVIDNPIYTVKPVPLDDEEYTLLEDPRVAGFTLSALATVFKE
ncbi:hypothetical protein IW261DRAFT_1420957 [Armillaria novae-zelandiae]|uniref:Uncharacterized protein n=1 Tax=Armillaria novae-zelandiae TaxID=153914 RepID=A0AA39U538_9AGAR|nr:hypothetical protein IW261DRAFT_1420957 [Armillaria novae-zelandiae]